MKFVEKISFKFILTLHFPTLCSFSKSLFSFVVKSLSLILILTIVWSRLKWIWQSQDTQLLWKWQIQINWSCWQTLWAICSESWIWQSHRLGQSTPPASLQKSVWERYCKLLYKKMIFPLAYFIQYTLGKLRQWRSKTFALPASM